MTKIHNLEQEPFCGSSSINPKIALIKSTSDDSIKKDDSTYSIRYKDNEKAEKEDPDLIERSLTPQEERIEEQEEPEDNLLSSTKCSPDHFLTRPKRPSHSKSLPNTFRSERDATGRISIVGNLNVRRISQKSNKSGIFNSQEKISERLSKISMLSGISGLTDISFSKVQNGPVVMGSHAQYTHGNMSHANYNGRRSLIESDTSNNARVRILSANNNNTNTCNTNTARIPACCSSRKASDMHGGKSDENYAEINVLEDEMFRAIQCNYDLFYIQNITNMFHSIWTTVLINRTFRVTHLTFNNFSLPLAYNETKRRNYVKKPKHG